MKAKWKEDWHVFHLPSSKSQSTKDPIAQREDAVTFGNDSDPLSFKMTIANSKEILVNGFEISVWVQKSEVEPEFVKVINF